MIIDGHAHACGEFLNLENTLKRMDSLNVDKIVLVPGEMGSDKSYSLPNLGKLFPEKNVVKVTNFLTGILIKATGAVKHIPEGNRHVYNLASKSNGRIIQFLWISALIDDPEKYLDEHLSMWNFKGVKLHQCWDKFKINSKFFITIASWAERNDLPLFIHLYSDNDVEELINYKINHPNLKLIVAHLFGVEKFIKNNIKDDNLYFDVSPFQLNSSERLLKAIEHFGSKRILMGSDTPYGKDTLYKNIHRIKLLKISDEEKKMILGDNMAKLLNII